MKATSIRAKSVMARVKSAGMFLRLAAAMLWSGEVTIDYECGTNVVAK